MYLKRLDIQGFKSFADRISLEFNKGITSVVGPNGSGKSNIADAVRWVLGEQSIKTLRGSRMEDVIFAGTEHRKPLGFAEVSLTVDNSDNTLPVEFNEITVTRRVFRSGESEYYINKTLCRLKDITEMFMDTGIGRDGYSIIGQGRIDEILSVRSEDRRRIFEEASGIMKYKMRKQEAEKKLEMTKQNMLRINDIIAELENQLEPLKQQAETARKYLDLRERLKELEVNVYIENIARFKERIAENEHQYRLVKENIDDENAKLEEITVKNRLKTELLKHLEERINISRQEYYNLEGKLERGKSDINLNNEKIRSLKQNIVRIEGEIAEINQKIEMLSKEEGTKQKRIEYLNDRHRDYSEKLDEYEKQMESVLASLDDTGRHMESMKEKVLEKMDMLSDKKTQASNTGIYIENIKKRRSTVSGEIYQLSVENDREKLNQEELEENVRKMAEGIKTEKEKLIDLVKRKGTAESGLNDLKKRQNSIKTELQYKASRYKMLQEMENSLEGYSRSVKEVLQVCRHAKDFGKGIYGAVAQLVTVGQKYETAVEMALGNALQNIVTENEECAKRAIEYLKKNKYGRATFLPLSSVKGRHLDAGIINGIRNMEGFCGVASDLAECDAGFREIVLNLLGRVVVVENIDSAIAMSGKYKYAFKIVTLEGDIFSTGGSITGGSIDGSRDLNILGRNREIAELKSGLEKLRADELALEKSISEAVADVNRHAAMIADSEGILRNREMEKIRDESHLGQIEDNIRKTIARIDMLKQEANQLSRQEKDTYAELEKYMKETLEIENEINESKRVIAEYEEKHREGQSTRDSLHRDITDFKISVNSILESIESVKGDIERIAGERNLSLKSINKRNMEKSKHTGEINTLADEINGLNYMIKSYEEEKTGKTLEMDRDTEEKKNIEEELSETVNLINEINRNILILQEEYGKIEVRKARIESEMEIVQNRLWDEYELTYTNALSLKKDIGSMSQAQKKINEFRDEIRELGPVNVAAIEEYIKTKERHEFMTGQRNDLEKAEAKLYRVIYEITAIMRQQFIEQFELINRNFNTVFKELFDGGHAELLLSDRENILESGIEIEVQPPGKRLQNMMLLSGGERAFVAIALLFAILRLHPTPFCILDEIEATLDDANVFRFAGYLRAFSEQTQFIMITHRKGTMEGSDTLYGVTMQEHGISKIVSMKMDEKAG